MTTGREADSSNGPDRDPVSGRFLPGGSGGPGRPRGRSWSAQIRDAVRDNCPPTTIAAIYAKVCEVALSGDMDAARLALKVGLGSQPLDLPAAGDYADARDQIVALIDAGTEGRLDPSAASSLARAALSLRQQDEVLARLIEIENKLESGGDGESLRTEADEIRRALMTNQEAADARSTATD